MPAVTPSVGQVWEFLVEATADSGNTLDINRVRFRLNKVNTANAFLANAPAVFLDAMAARWKNNVLPLLINTYDVVRYNLQCITSVTGQAGPPQVLHTHFDGRMGVIPDPAEHGAVNDPPNPDFVTVNVQLKCAIVSRNTRGRMGLSPFSDNQLDGQLINGGYVTSVSDAMKIVVNTFSDGTTNGLWVPVVFSGRLALNASMGTNYDGAVAYASDITSIAVSQDPGSQLHRKIRGAS